MLIYKNTFDNVKTIGFKFPIEDQFYASETEAIVADGITRDPIGIADLSTCSFEEFLENTPAKRRNRRAKPAQVRLQRVRQRHKSAVTFVKQSYCNIFYRKKQVFMQ